MVELGLLGGCRRIGGGSRIGLRRRSGGQRGARLDPSAPGNSCQPRPGCPTGFAGRRRRFRGKGRFPRNPVACGGLHYWGDMPILLALLDAGANTEARNIDGKTPIHLAVQFNGKLAAVQTLLDAGADIEVSDQSGWTPLHMAAIFNEDPAVVRALLDAHANPEARDVLGNTPLNQAIEYHDDLAVMQVCVGCWRRH